jgi:hypothetical protein
MVTGEAPVKQVDHIAIRADRLEPVYSLFSETLGLPHTWPVTAYPLFSTVGLCAGNVDLEILQLGGRGSGSAPTPAGASFYGIAFESRSLADTLVELDRRRISHSAPIPQVEVREAGSRATLWATAYLGGLIDRSRMMTLFMASSKCLPQAFVARAFASEWFGRSPLARTLWDIMPREGVAFIVEWGPGFLEDLRRERESAEAALRAQDGGRLGLKGVEEIVVGVQELGDTDRCWQELLAPALPAAPGVWSLGNGLSVRFVRSTRNAIQALVLKVASLDGARSFLRETNLLGESSEDQVRVDPAAAHGLDIRLVE